MRFSPLISDDMYNLIIEGPVPEAPSRHPMKAEETLPLRRYGLRVAIDVALDYRSYWSWPISRLGSYFNETHGPAGSGAASGIIQTHKSIGLTVLMLSLVRLGWRLINPVPALPADTSAGAKLLAHVTHYLLYFLMITIPLPGWMVASAARTGHAHLLFRRPSAGRISAFIGDLLGAGRRSLYGRLYRRRAYHPGLFGY